MASLNLPFGLRVLNGLPVDNKYYNLADTPYTNTAQVLAQIPSGARYPGLTVVVGTGGSLKEYWWKLTGGVTDGELIVKTDSSTLAGTGGAALVGFDNSGTGLSATTVQAAILEIKPKIGMLVFVEDNTGVTNYTTTGWSEVTANFQDFDNNGNLKGLYLKAPNIDPSYENAGNISGDWGIDPLYLPKTLITNSIISPTISSNGDHNHGSGSYLMPNHSHNITTSLDAVSGSKYISRVDNGVSGNEYVISTSGSGTASITGISSNGGTHNHSFNYSGINLNTNVASQKNNTPRYRTIRIFKRTS